MIKLNLNLLQIDREQFMALLRSSGIGVSVHFIPIPIHPYFQRNKPRYADEVPRAMAIYERLISLPLYPGLTDEQVRHVADTVKEIVRRFRRTAQIAVAS
jgi:dTDP-4-amino-4,6-dideoxygalactose transaminase